MAYQVEYAYTCHTGKVRNNNEDNFWCCGESLSSENQGMSHIQSGRIKQSEIPVMAVFDGMGGESCGEMAAYLAAQTCGQHYSLNKTMFREKPEYFLIDLCNEMNRTVCNYSKENKISSMGTTAAVLAFGAAFVYGCNLGDSRIYLSKEGHFRRISTDHVLGGGLFGKSPLTQYVGIPEENMGLEPSITKQEAAIGVRFLLCSDGITDMLSDGEIADVLTREISVEETVELLLERALKKGGRDNITIVLCEITESEKTWLQRLADWFHKRYEGDIK